MISTPGIFSVALIAVCVKPETAEAMIRAAETMPWLVTSNTFESYISPVRRPSFDPVLRSAEGVIAVVDFDADPDEAAAATAYLHQTFAGKIRIAALSENKDPLLLMQAMRAGCSEFLPKSQGLNPFTEMLGRMQAEWSQTRRNAPEGGSLLAFLGVKGGVGATTLAVNLALHLCQTHGQRVLLVDSHAALGHACLYLGLDGNDYRFEEVVRNVSRLDSELLGAFTAKHESGLEVLASPDRCSNLQALDANSLARTLEFLCGEFDYVLVDCDRSLDPAALAVLDAATRIYLIAVPEMGAVRDLSRYVERFSDDDHANKIDVVINRSSARHAIDLDNLEKAIRRPIAIKFPNSYMDVVRPMNLGEPISPANDKSEFTQQLSKWASTLTGATGPSVAAKKEHSIFALWKTSPVS